MFTDRINVQDTNQVSGTMKLHQVQGTADTETDDSNHRFFTSILPCSCPKCRIDPTGAAEGLCLYKSDRKIKEIFIVEKKDDVNTDENDPYGIKSLTVAELKKELASRGLIRTGLKAQLVERLTQDM